MMQQHVTRTKIIGGDLYRLFRSRQTIHKRIGQLARKIGEDYKDRFQPPILLWVLTGGAYLGVGVSKYLDYLGVDNAVDTIGLRRYSQDEETISQVEIVSRPHADFAGRDVIVVEDMVDEGPTMNFLHSYLQGLPVPPRSVEYCILGLRRQHGPLDFTIKYLGFEVEPGWLVGYGLDSNQRLRGLPDIWIKVDKS